MDMKRVLTFFCLLCLFASCSQKGPVTMVMETTMGDIEFRLYDETPLHRENFIKLAEEHYFDSLLFHRVIEDFMIQGGDPNSRNAEPGQFLGDGDPGYTVPAEFRLDEGIYHKRGVIGAAREGNDVNPEMASCASQFYFVWGKVFDDEGLDRTQERIDRETGGKVKLTPEMREYYKTYGGTPHLDGQYTVFGEITEGLDVVEAIQKMDTDENDRPLTDVRIMKVYQKSQNSSKSRKEAVEEQPALEEEYAPKIEFGTPVEDFTVKTSTGDDFTFSSLKGSYAVLDFWASWCPDCRKEIPAVRELWKEFEPKGVKFVSFSVDDSEEAWKGAIADEGMEWLQVSNIIKWKENPVAIFFGMGWIPTMFLIDPEGNIAGFALTAASMRSLLQSKMK